MSYSTHLVEDHGLDAEGVEALEAAHRSIASRAEQAMRMNQEIGHWFTKGMACHRACLDNSLTRSSLFVYAVLMQHMQAEHQWAWPSYATIMRETGLSKDGVERAIKQLKAHGYILSTRKAPPQGGRALVHYGLGSVADMIGDYLGNYRTPTPIEMQGSANLTPTEKPGSAPLTPLKMSGTIGDIIAAHSAQNAGVGVPDPDQNAGVSPPKQAHPDNSVASIFVMETPSSNTDTSVREDGVSTTSVSSSSTVAGAANFFDEFMDLSGTEDRGPCPGVEIPSGLVAAIRAGTAPTASRNFIDAVKSAQRRKVEAFKIEMACRKAVAAACKDAGEKEPPPSALLTRAVWYVERSDGEAIAVPLEPRSNGVPRARNMNRDFEVPPPDPTLSIYGGGWEY